jgi:methyl-accepting chemotaxis protein
MVGIDQIASVMENIRLVTQQNSDGIKQVEKAAHDLNMLGLKLKTMAQEGKV